MAGDKAEVVVKIAEVIAAGLWYEEPVYGCSLCQFTTLDKAKAEEHAAKGPHETPHPVA